MKANRLSRESVVVLSIQTGLTILLLGVWELLGHASERMTFLLSRPSMVAVALLAMIQEGLAMDILVTGGEALSGIAIGTIVGSSLGLLLWLSTRIAKISNPFIVVVSNFPIFALAPAAIVWIGVGFSLKVFLAAFATLFVSLKLAFDGAGRVSDSYASVFEGFGASRGTMFRKAIMPGALNAVFSSMRINVGLGLLGAFIGEFLASDSGLGHVILKASGLYQMDRVFAGAVCIVLLALMFDFLGRGIESRRLLFAQLFGVPRVLRRIAGGHR